MIKYIYCLRRLPHLSLEEFQTHWLEHFSQFHRQGLKPVRRQVQYHALAHDPTREVLLQAAVSTIEPFDGAAVAWWDSLDAMHAQLGKADLTAAFEDVKLFIDASRSIGCLTEEQVVVEPEGSVPYVLIGCLRRRSDIDRTAFVQASHSQAEVSRRLYAQGLLKGYIQNYPLLQKQISDLGAAYPISAMPWDGITMSYFDSVAKFKAMGASSLLTRELFEEEKKFIDHSQSIYMLTRRHMTKNIIR